MRGRGASFMGMAQKYVLGIGISLLFLNACAKQESSVVTVPIDATNPQVEKTLGESTPYVVMGPGAFQAAKADKRINADTSEAIAYLNRIANLSGETVVNGLGNAGQTSVAANSLVVGFPIGLLGEQQLFGGVVTKTDAAESETLGRLKLMDIEPIHVKTVVAKGDAANQFVLGLVGCLKDCSEGSEQKGILGIPVVGVDEKKGVVFVDLASLGEELNLVEMLDPKGEYTQLKTKSAKTVAVDYSVSTLVFDVEVTMVPLKAEVRVAEKETKFTVRWYLRLASKFHPEFQSRPETDGVGFFMTSRAKASKIQRFVLPSQGQGGLNAEPVKYYIKNVPEEYKKSFAHCFDVWNDKFIELTGKKLLAYEFVDATDPRAALLVPGDVRYNIVEWDLVNRAPYGGLGPSIANQFTGEILSANVLVQGPHIVKIYKEWFEKGKVVQDLMEEGSVIEALTLMRETADRLNAQLTAGSLSKYSLSLKDIAFRSVSEMAALEDPIVQREDFDLLPSGYSFTTYMDGYFLDLLGHELGHNLGLRHNFRGNLSFTSLEKGKVSHSIMEYLGRGFRHLDDVGVYDVIALKYGYLGVQPSNRTLFCTDEDVPDKDNLGNSAECSRDDATQDPFGFLDERLERAVSLLIGRGLDGDPVWKVGSMSREIAAVVPALGMYAATAEKTSAKWTNFNLKGDRPTTSSEIVKFVKAKLNSKVCPKDLDAVLAGKSEGGKQIVRDNLEALRKSLKENLLPLKVFSEADFACE